MKLTTSSPRAATPQPLTPVPGPQSLASASTPGDTAAPPVLEEMLTEARNFIGQMLDAPNGPGVAKAVDVLMQWAIHHKYFPSELARIAPEILGAFAQKGRQAPDQCIDLFHQLEEFMSLLGRNNAIHETVIRPELLEPLMDGLILPALYKYPRDLHIATSAMRSCSILINAKHDDITPLYRLASILLDRAIGDLLSPIARSEIFVLIDNIPDPQMEVAFAERVMTSIEALPATPDSLLGFAMDLAEGKDQLGMHLGKLLLRSTAHDAATDTSMVVRLLNGSLPLYQVIQMFKHPAISEHDKTIAAAHLAVALDQCKVSDPTNLWELIVRTAPFMGPAEKIATATWLRECHVPLKPNFQARDCVSGISKLVAHVNDDEVCRCMQDLLRAECARYKEYDPLNAPLMLSECIRLDPAGGQRFLADLLALVDVPTRDWSHGAFHLIAIATFQADPEGLAFVPGSEVVDMGKNPLSDSYIDRGTRYVYPDWLSKLRAELHAFSLRSSGPAAAHIYDGIPRNLLPLAQIEQEYTGITVRPSDWPALLAHLDTVFARVKWGS